MKKFYLLLVSVVLILSGCDINTTEVVRPGVEMYTVYKTVEPEDWMVYNERLEDENDGRYKYFVFDIKEIDNSVLKDGAVLVYFVNEIRNTDNLLPYIFPVYNGRNDVMQNIRFDVGRGKLTVIVEWEDSGIYTIRDPYKFKICILAPGDK